MSMPTIFALLGGLLVVAFAANRLFYHTRIPDVIILMALGVVLGPVLHVVAPSEFRPISGFFGNLALVLILFEGGLELDIRDAVTHFPAGLLLSILTYTLTLAAVALVVRFSLHASFEDAILAGAVLGCTSSSVVLPILQQLEASKAARTVMMLDASLNDVLAVVTVGALLKLHLASSGVALHVAGVFVTELGLSVIFAIVVALVWGLLLSRVAEGGFRQVLTFAVVLLLYAGAERAYANGLVAVLAFGLCLANIRRLKPYRAALPMRSVAEPEAYSETLHFHSELAFLIRSFFFVLMGVVVKLQGLEKYKWAVVGILAAIFVARWLAVLASRWTWRVALPAERELPVWLLPRGLITVVLALQIIESRGQYLSYLIQISFVVILVTNLLAVVASVRAERIAAAGDAAGGSIPQPLESEKSQ